MVEVVLSEAQQLPASAFTVMMKEYSSGKYNHKCAVTKISTSDQKVYTPVSYTHLDVYKRQYKCYEQGITNGCI